jgi:hypothetical protein
MQTQNPIMNTSVKKIHTPRLFAPWQMLLIPAVLAGLLFTPLHAQEEEETEPAEAAVEANPLDPAVAHAGLPRDLPVWHRPGHNRGHTEDDPRYRRMTAAQREGMELITLEELERRGALLTSTSPGSNTPGRGNQPPQFPSWVNPPPAEIPVHPFVPSPREPLVSMGPDGRLVYRSFTERGDQIMDWSHVGYKNSAAPIPHAPVVETLVHHLDEPVRIGNLAYPEGRDSREEIQAAIDRVAAMAQMPALIRAYLRLGGYVGEGAYIDHEFNCIDVCLVMDVALIPEASRSFYQRGSTG